MLAAPIIALLVVAAILVLLLVCVKSPDFLYPTIEQIEEVAVPFTIVNSDDLDEETDDADDITAESTI